ncbi:uncharacterized protein Dvar_52170 [Desulfosarcina variabilis str. Montpellier]
MDWSTCTLIRNNFSMYIRHAFRKIGAGIDFSRIMTADGTKYGLSHSELQFRTDTHCNRMMLILLGNV